MLTVQVNGRKQVLDVDPTTPLLWVLRDELDLTGSKLGCGAGLCGACTVHIDGQATRSCITHIDSVGDRSVVTIEAITSGTDRVGTAVRDAWIKHDVAQCGYCQSGQIMSATSFLKSLKPGHRPSVAEIDAAMAGNICRCGTYQRIRVAIADAARSLT